MRSLVLVAMLACSVFACGDDANSSPNNGAAPPGTPGTPGSAPPGTPGATPPPTNPEAGPKAGNPDGHATVPVEAQAEDTSHPTNVIGDGTAASCTSAAVVSAIAKGGIITFNCGADPITIKLTETAKIFNDKGPIVIDGGGKVTLSGDGKVRILYMSTCDKDQVSLGGNCNDQTEPSLTVQNITFIDGNAKTVASQDQGDRGGGAIYAQGGLLKVVNARFFNNICDDAASDVGGGAIRKLDYLKDSAGDRSRKVWVVSSTFGGQEGFGNTCANGGALSSVGISWTILNSLFSFNKAIGMGANDGNGGNGGAIYNDGNDMHLDVEGTIMTDNHANEGGSAIFFVSNNHTGALTIKDSTLKNNPKGAFQNKPGIYFIAVSDPEIINSTVEN